MQYDVNKTEQETPFVRKLSSIDPTLYIIFWSFQPSPKTVKRMALISLPPCIYCCKILMGSSNMSEQKVQQFEDKTNKWNSVKLLKLCLYLIKNSKIHFQSPSILLTIIPRAMYSEFTVRLGRR